MACIEDDSTAVRLNEQVAIKLGKSISVADSTTQVIFAEVLEDSRCPKGTSCIWAGQAKVRLETNDGAKVELTLPGMQEETEVTASIGNLTVLCYGLNPYPESGKPHEPSAYELSLELRATP